MSKTEYPSLVAPKTTRFPCLYCGGRGCKEALKVFRDEQDVNGRIKRVETPADPPFTLCEACDGTGRKLES